MIFKNLNHVRTEYKNTKERIKQYKETIEDYKNDIQQEKENYDNGEKTETDFDYYENERWAIIGQIDKLKVSIKFEEEQLIFLEREAKRFPPDEKSPKPKGMRK